MPNRNDMNPEHTDYALLTREAIAAHLTGGDIGVQMEIHDEIASTNTRARELARQGAPHGTLVLARRQSAGRGRFDRRFYSPDGTGLYLSIILRPDVSADRAVLLTPMAAVAVARAMEHTAGVKAEIKWVNDVYIGPRKACGILCESGMDFETGRLQYVVMGIGVNVGPMDFPPELMEIATSLSNECGRAVARSRFCGALVNEINALYPQLESGAFMDEYRVRSNVIGREVLVLRGEERYAATALDIDGEGSLVVRTMDDRVQTLHSGEISVRFC